MDRLRDRFRIRFVRSVIFAAYLVALLTMWPVEVTVVRDPGGPNERWFFNRRDQWDPPTEYYWRNIEIGWPLLFSGAALFAVTCFACKS